MTAKVAQLAKPGTAAGPTRVGGFLGFSNRLDTALRGALGDTVVMRVRADRPSYWIGETFDTWDGANWIASPTPHGPQRLDEDSPFVLSGPAAPPATASADLQTFYVVQSSPNLVFHADIAHEVWFPTHDLFVSAHDSIVSPIGLGPGAIYTVESYVDTPSVDQLRAAAGPSAVPASIIEEDATVTHPYPRVKALAEKVSAGETTTYDKVQSLIALDRQAHALLDRHPPARTGPGHRRRIPLRQPHRLLRADLHLAGRDAALHRHPGARSGRLRPRALQPHHRPLRRPGQGRARLGAGVVPGLRVAELRPHRGGAAGQPVAGVDAVARGRRRARAGSPGCPWRSSSP